MLPEVLDFRMTSQCNMNCAFCFGTKRLKKINIDNLRNFFVNLKLNGVKSIVLTGGEPTLTLEFEYIIAMLKELRFNIVISTNGTFWKDEKLRELVIRSVDWMALPVDSCIRSQHNEMRGAEFDHYSLIMDILCKVKTLAPHVKIKIGTVVTRKNIDNVRDILKILPTEPDLWKIYQLSEAVSNQKYYVENSVEKNSFDKLIFDLRHCYHNHRTRITYMYEQDRNQQYLFLDPDGNLITIESNSETVIGSYCDDFEKIIQETNKHVDTQKTNNNFNDSFG